MSLDGYASTGPNDEQSWVTWALQDIKPHVLELLNSIDTILIGRKLAIDYIPYWQDVFTQRDHPMYEFAERIVEARKIVFTRSLTESSWDNTKLAKGELVAVINELKSQPGKDIIVYGGTSFVADLVLQELIDEFHFFINPVVLGKGVSVFTKLDKFRQLQLRRSIIYDSGIVMLHYEPRKLWSDR